MTPVLYAHPFSSYCWKVLIPLWENGTRFDYRRLDAAANGEAWARAWPLRRMPLLVDGAAVIPEATVIIEHLQLFHPGPVLMIPADPAAALKVRLLDRLSDNYLMAPLQAIVSDRIRNESQRNPTAVEQAHGLLDTAYAWWNDHLQGHEWAADAFGLADCAAAPALFYTDWIHPIPDQHTALRRYRQRLMSRPSVARAVDEARPFRSLFPFGDPGRD